MNETLCAVGFDYNERCQACKPDDRISVEFLQFARGIEIWALFPIVEYIIPTKSYMTGMIIARSVFGAISLTPLFPIGLMMSILIGFIMSFQDIKNYETVELCYVPPHFQGYLALGMFAPMLFFWSIAIVACFLDSLCLILHPNLKMAFNARGPRESNVTNLRSNAVEMT